MVFSEYVCMISFIIKLKTRPVDIIMDMNEEWGRHERGVGVGKSSDKKQKATYMWKSYVKKCLYQTGIKMQKRLTHTIALCI